MFHLQLAGYSFTIDNHFAYLEHICRDYRMDTPGEMISIHETDIEREQTDGGQWPLGYLESLAAYRKICERLLFRDVVLFHCSALEFHQKGYLFAAPSGTGKSTHTRLWRECLGDEVKMINDDKPLLQIGLDNVTVYGTPFAGKEGLQENTSAPVGGNRHPASSQPEQHPEAVASGSVSPVIKSDIPHQGICRTSQNLGAGGAFGRAAGLFP